jgi:hypothetical protein
MRGAPRGWLAALALLAATQAPARSGAPARGDPFEFLQPWVVLSDADRRRLDRDEVVARTLPAGDGQLAVFVATRLEASPDALVAWTRAIAELKRSRFVLAIGRFSDPPDERDLDTLTLDARDLDAIRRCVPGDCGLKLSAGDISVLSRAAAAGGEGWREAVQREFRRLLVNRVNAYRAGGLAALPAPADRARPRSLDASLTAIVEASPYLDRLPAVATWLREYPAANASVESFFYWSKEFYGEGKPVISITHVGIVRPGPDRRLPAVLVAGKQILATHYANAGLGLTMILEDTAGTPYLVYLNRTELDLLRGFFGPFARGILEARLGRHAPRIVAGLRARLESGAVESAPWSSYRQP